MHSEMFSNRIERDGGADPINQRVQPSVGMINRIVKLDFSSVGSDTFEFFSNMP